MDTDRATDVLDGVTEDVHELYPDLELSGLPISGRVVRLARLIERLHEEQLRELGLTTADFDVIATMRRRARSGTMNVRELQPSTMLSSGGTTKRLDRLEAAGLLERLPDPNDRRGVLIRLTAQGLAIADQAIPAITLIDNEFVTGSIDSPKVRASVADGLRQMLIELESAEES